MPYLVRGDPLRGIFLEDMLDGTWRDVMPLLAEEQRSFDPVADEPGYILERFMIDEHYPNLAAFPADLDRLVFEIDIFYIHPAELRDPDTGSVNRPDDQPVPIVFDGSYQAEDLAMLQIPKLLILDLGAFDPSHRICRNHPLGIKESEKRAHGGDDPVSGLGFVRLHRVNKSEIVRDENRPHIDTCVEPGLGEVLPVEHHLLGIGIPSQPDIVSEMADHLLISSV